MASLVETNAQTHNLHNYTMTGSTIFAKAQVLTLVSGKYLNIQRACASVVACVCVSILVECEHSCRLFLGDNNTFWRLTVNGKLQFV